MNYFRWEYHWTTEDGRHQVFFIQEKLQGCWWVDTDERVSLEVGQVCVVWEVDA